MPLIDALAEWTAAAPPLDREPALGLARDAFADIAACLVAGAGDEATRRVLAAARGWGDGPATAVGERLGLAAPWAALVNGAAAHALDFDDNFHPQGGHATAAIAPALLALGEERGASGAQVLDAYVAGLEILGRVSQGINMTHYERGWHSTSTVGALGVAAACARLLRLDADGVRRAISLGFSMASGTKLQFGTMAKPVHAGLAACHGLIAACLAERGVTAAADPLEPAWGLRDLYAGPESPGFAGLDRRVGRPLAIEEFGLKVKIHPCCASAHTAIDAVIALAAETGFKPDDVDRIETFVHPVSIGNLRYADPKNELEARFSMSYCVALALVEGRLRLADFRPEAVRRPELRAWYPRISMRPPEPGSPLAAVDAADEPAFVAVHLKDGRRLERLERLARGVLERPLTASERQAKLADCAEGVLEPTARDRLAGTLDRLPALSRIGELARLLRFEGKEGAQRAAQ